MIRSIKGTYKLPPGVYLRFWDQFGKDNGFAIMIHESIVFYTGKLFFTPKAFKKHTYGFCFTVCNHHEPQLEKSDYEIRRRIIQSITPTVSKVIIRDGKFHILWVLDN